MWVMEWGGRAYGVYADRGVTDKHPWGTAGPPVASYSLNPTIFIRVDALD